MPPSGTPRASVAATSPANDMNLMTDAGLRERHGHKTPKQIRAEQKALASEATTEFKLAA